MNSRKPYLLQGIYSWIIDNACTPHLVIAYPGAGWVSGVPEHLLQEDMLVLNISPQATQGLSFDQEYCSFKTRFSGQAYEVFVAITAVHALIARENGEGMTFELDGDIADGPPKTNDNKEDKSNTKHLKILK